MTLKRKQISKRTMIYVLLFLGIAFTILGLYFGLKSIDIKIYNLLVAVMLGVLALFGFLGKYNQEVKSGENISNIRSTATETHKNTEKINSEIDSLRGENQIMLEKYEALVSQNQTLKNILDQQSVKLELESKIRKDSDTKNLRASLREYDELVKIYHLQLYGLIWSFSNPMKYEVLQLDNLEFRTRWNEFATTSNNILKTNLVSGNDGLYNQWQTLNTEVFTTLMFCSIPNGQIYYEPNSSYEVTLAIKREKLSRLNKRFQDDVNNESGAIGLLIKRERNKL